MKGKNAMKEGMYHLGMHYPSDREMERGTKQFRIPEYNHNHCDRIKSDTLH